MNNATTCIDNTTQASLDACESNRILYDGQLYNSHSEYQKTLSKRLIDRIDCNMHRNVLDVGCGNGIVTMNLWLKNPLQHITGIDISPSQISMAKKNFSSICEKLSDVSSYKHHVSFHVLDVYDLTEISLYDLVFSNFALHWLHDPESGYRRIFDSLVPGGQLAVQQGCKDGLSGLHHIVRKAIKNLDFAHMYKGWKFPRWSPSKNDILALLIKTGFIDIDVELICEELPKSQSLIEDFIAASLIFYRLPVLSDNQFNDLQNEFRRICFEDGYDSSDCNLIITAIKP